MKAPLLLAFVAGALVGASAAPAHAGGLTFSDRGVRPMSRGGAFVAGADDLGATWYNPAGIIDAGSSVLVDTAQIFFSSEYTRRTVVTDGGGAQYEYTFPTSRGKMPFLPIPTIVGSLAFGKNKEWVAALGVMGPYAIAPEYPEDGAQRYTVIDQHGSALAFTGAWLAYKPIEQIRIGAGVMMLNGFYSTAIAFNANPRDRLLSSPEDRQYDSIGQLNAGFIASPGFNAGVTAIPEKHVRLGASVMSGFVIHQDADLAVRLPNAAPFDRAGVQGDSARLRLPLPWVLRLGVEVRPVENLRVEFTWVRDFWATARSIDVTIKDVALTNVTGFPSPYKVNDISIPLGLENGNSFRLGGEYTFRNVENLFDLDLRAGVMIDPSATPAKNLSVLTFDTGKTHLGLGAGVHLVKQWRVDVMYMHTFFATKDVDPREAAIAGINPVRGNPTSVEAVNGGRYSASANTFGGGVEYKF